MKNAKFNKLSAIRYLLSAIILFCLILPQLARAATYYVDKNHPATSDANPGTEALPWLTIDKAVTTVAPGDAVYIKGSTDPNSPDAVYSVASHGMNIVTPGVDGQVITYSAYPGHTVIISYSGTDTGDYGICMDYASYHTFVGLTIKGFNVNVRDILAKTAILYKTNVTFDHCTFTYSTGQGWCMLIKRVTNFTMTDCTIHDNAGVGINLAECTNVTLINVDSYNNWDQDGLNGIATQTASQGDADGFSTTIVNNAVFINCRAWNNTEDGFDLSGDSVLINCMAWDQPGNNFKAFRRSQDGYAPHTYYYYNCISSGSGGWGFVSSHSAEMHLYNCIIDHAGTYKGIHNYDGGASGFHIYAPDQGAATCTLNNCIISNSTHQGVDSDSGGIITVDCDHNLYYNNPDPNLYLHSDTNFVVSDPLFVDAAAINFRLQSESPAIDAGIALAANQGIYNLYGIDTRRDFAGNMRPYGTAWDIGAYEFTSIGILYGDVSGDSEISAYDAALTAQAAVGLITLTAEQTQKADVSGDAEVSAYDAALIAQKAVGLIDKFTVEEE